MVFSPGSARAAQVVQYYSDGEDAFALILEINGLPLKLASILRRRKLACRAFCLCRESHYNAFAVEHLFDR